MGSPPDREQTPTGVGLGLRWAFLDRVAAGEAAETIRFYEVSPENYMRRGGSIPDALDQVAQRHPILTHGLMMNVGGTTPLDPDYLRELSAFLGRMGARYHSDHLCWTGADGHILHDLLPLPHDAQAVARCVDQIARIEDALGLPFAVENISYYMVPAGGMPEEAFLGEVLEQADCGLLLDVNNVAVNAANHGFDPIAFLSALPLSRVVQLHVAGGQRRPQLDDLVIDTHGTDVSEQVQALMAWVIERTGPRPVIYERDHDIPPLPELVRQVTVLQGVYDEAVARHRARQAGASIADPPRPAIEVTGMRSMEGVQRGLSRMIVDRTAVVGVREDAAGWLREHGVQAPDDQALAEIGAQRLLVYRRLVRNGLWGTARAFLPRTAARLGDDGFDRAFAAWLHEGGPRSRYLRDTPGELVQWAQGAWPDDDAVPDYLADLARLEIVESEIEAAPDRLPAGIDEVLDLARPVVFTGAVRLLRCAWAVHRLPRATADRTEPEREDVRLLLYRDRAQEVRTLELSPLAEAVLGRLVQGQALGEAIQEGTVQAAEAIDGEVLGRLSALLADLAQRDVLRGAAPS